MQAEINVLDYMGTLRRWLWLVVLGLLLGLAGGFVAARPFGAPTPDIYEAEAVVTAVKPLSQAKLSDYQTLSDAPLDFAGQQRSLLLVARNPDIAAAVAAALKDTSSFREINSSVLLNFTSVSVDGNLIRIKVKQPRPDLAVQAANTWARVYTQRVNQLYTEVSASLEQLEAQGTTSFRDYQAAEAAYGQFLSENRIDSLRTQIDAKQQTIADLQNTRQGLTRLLQDVSLLQRMIRQDPLLAQNDIANSLAILVIRANAASLAFSAPNAPSTNPPDRTDTAPESALSSNPVTLNMENPKSAALQIQLSLSSRDALTQGNLSAQVDLLAAALQSREDQIDAQIEDPSLGRQVLALQKDLELESARKQELYAARELAWSGYKAVMTKIQEVKLTQQPAGTVLRLAVPASDAALANDAKQGANLFVAMGLGAAIGLLLALGIAFAWELLDGTIHSARDISRDLSVDAFETTAQFAHDSRQPETVPSPQLYHLWANLFLARASSTRTVLVAAADASPKTVTLVATLAVISAQAGKSVVVVDADSSRPSLHEIFHVPISRGWSNLMVDELPVAVDYIQPTGVPNLRLVTNGTVSLPTREPLVSPRLAAAIAAIAGQADMVIFHAPPAAVSADALLIGKQVEAVLLAVTERRTRREAAMQLGEQLKHMGAQVLAIIVLGSDGGPLAQLAARLGLARRQRTAPSFSPSAYKSS